MEFMKSFKNIITFYLEQFDTISTAQAYDLFREKEKNIPKNTVSRRLHYMVKEGSIECVGRGNFRLNTHSKINFEITQIMKDMAEDIKAGFPLISYCIWTTDILKSLSHHVQAESFILVDVEKEGMDAVLHFLSEKYDYVFKEDVYFSAKESLPRDKQHIIIRLLVSEAPVYKVNNVPVPGIEKMLVDFFCDTAVFNFLKGNELVKVWQNAFDKSIINRNRLLRYANRRGRKKDILNLIKQVTNKEI